MASIYSILDTFISGASVNFNVFNKWLKEGKDINDTEESSVIKPTLYQLVKKFNYTDAQYMELIDTLSDKKSKIKLSRQFWTDELLAYVKTVDVKTFSFNVIQKLRPLGAKLTITKEQLIKSIKALPALEQLAVLDNAIFQKTHDLNQFFGVQRRLFKARRSFQTLIEMRKALKETIIEHIKKQTPEQQLILLNECLKTGTALNQLFTTQRGICKVGSQYGTLKILSDMQKKVTWRIYQSSLFNSKKPPAPVEDKTLSKRLLDIGFDLSAVPEELCCAVTFDIMSKPILMNTNEDGEKKFCDKKTLQDLFMRNPKEDTFLCPVTLQKLYKVGMLDNIDKDKQTECVAFVIKEEQAYAQKKQEKADQKAEVCNQSLTG